MIFVDGVYIDGAPEFRARFCWVKTPTSEEHRRIYKRMKQEFTFNPRASMEV